MLLPQPTISRNTPGWTIAWHNGTENSSAIIIVTRTRLPSLTIIVTAPMANASRPGEIQIVNASVLCQRNFVVDIRSSPLSRSRSCSCVGHDADGPMTIAECDGKTSRGFRGKRLRNLLCLFHPSKVGPSEPLHRYRILDPHCRELRNRTHRPPKYEGPI